MAQLHDKMQIPIIYLTKQLDQTGRGQLTSTDGKAIPLHARTGRLVSKAFRPPVFLDICHMKVVRLSALRTGLLYRQGDMSGNNFC
jgi:hypothetical protein